METTNNKPLLSIQAAAALYLNAHVNSCLPLGSGAQGKLYKVSIDKEPFELALKLSDHAQLLQEEYDNIRFLQDHAEIKLPRLYFLHLATEEIGQNMMAMEYFPGSCAADKKFRWRSRAKKRNFSKSAIDNLEKLHQVKNNKFGPVGNAVYDDWHAYYRPLANWILEQAEAACKDGKFPEQVFSVMKTAFNRYDDIFCEKIGKPTLIHGDYWPPNLIIDDTTMELIGVVDPFNILWADPDYELFTLTADGYHRYKLYEEYKKRFGISDRCDLKNEFYALFSEVLWFTRLGTKFDSFLIYKAKLLKKQMKRFKLL